MMSDEQMPEYWIEETALRRSDNSGWHIESELGRTFVGDLCNDYKSAKAEIDRLTKALGEAEQRESLVADLIEAVKGVDDHYSIAHPFASSEGDYDINAEIEDDLATVTMIEDSFYRLTNAMRFIVDLSDKLEALTALQQTESGEQS